MFKDAVFFACFFKGVSKKFQGVLRKCQRCFREISNMFLEGLKGD